MTEHTEQKVITGAERLGTSASGNPRYRVTFADGTDARTKIDASVNFGITNSDIWRRPVNVTFERGQIVHVETLDGKSGA